MYIAIILSVVVTVLIIAIYCHELGFDSNCVFGALLIGFLTFVFSCILVGTISSHLDNEYYTSSTETYSLVSMDIESNDTYLSIQDNEGVEYVFGYLDGENNLRCVSQSDNISCKYKANAKAAVAITKYKIKDEYSHWLFSMKPDSFELTIPSKDKVLVK